MSEEITLTITRILNAPREIVFNAWADPEQCSKWCCPIGYEVTFRDADVRKGGNYRTGMSDGKQPEKIYGGNFIEVSPPEKLVFEHHWDDTDEYSYPHTTCTVELIDLGDKTEMIFTQVGFNVVPEKEGHNIGWNEIFDKLGNFVQGEK